MVLKNKKEGFTLIELLVSVVILGIVFMYGLLNMVIMGSTYLITMKHSKNANYLLTEYIETLSNMEFDSPYLSDDGDSTDLNISDPTLADFSAADTIEGVPYDIAWNIAENLQGTRKKIRIYVIWRERKGEKKIYRQIEIWRK